MRVTKTLLALAGNMPATRTACLHRQPTVLPDTLYCLPAQVTKALLDLAGNMPAMRAFVYVSSAYANCNVPRKTVRNF